jgi:hypothetical protein
MWVNAPLDIYGQLQGHSPWQEEQLLDAWDALQEADQPPVPPEAA